MLFFGLFSASPACAAIMFLKGSDEPLHVLTIREDASSVTVGVPQADGTFTERVYEKRNVEDFIRTVDAKRLAELSPEKPSAYRDYAEELAEKKVDPDARAAALRLYVIAAHLDPENLGRSSLLGMTALARSPLEERRIRALSYLLDPAHDARLLKENIAATAGAATGDDKTGSEALLSMIRSLRKGQGAIARRVAERDESEAIFLAHGRGLTQKEFLALCRLPQPLPANELARLIRLELALTGGASTPEPAADEDKSLASWSTALATGDTAPVAPLSLETLTEFDPRLSVYRDGKWVAP